MLCVDEDSGLINNNKHAGVPFYDDNKELAKPVKDILLFLSQVEQSRTQTDAAVSCLAESGLLKEWALTVKVGEKKRKAAGLYRVDEASLNSLDDEKFLKVRKALPIAYAQMLSMGHIMLLEKMAEKQQQVNGKAPDITPSLGDDDIISFQ
jgi:hypothetical protein